MPFPFTLSTTSHLNLESYIASPTHPSLVSTATTHRTGLRNALKHHKRLPLSSQPSNLIAVLSAVSTYLPYINVIVNPPANVEISHTSQALAAEWRPTLSSPPPGMTLPSRAKITSLQADFLYTLLTVGSIYYLLARSSLHSLSTAHNSLHPPTPEQRTTAIAAAMKHYMSAQQAFAYAASGPSSTTSSLPADIALSTLRGLASLALSEATLLACAKEDPYPAAAAASVNPNDKDWMVGAPSIPKVRAHLFARLCIAGADHASTALASFSQVSAATKLDEDLIKYSDALQRTCRARACRFLAIDAEAQGQTGHALGYVQAAQALLSGSASPEPAASSTSRFASLKSSWSTKREDKKLAKSGAWGSDAGRLEESRVTEMLKTEWERGNAIVGFQAVADAGGLLASMPQGREYHNPAAWKPSGLDANILSRMKAPAPARKLDDDGNASSGDDDEGVPGGWPEGREGYY